MAGLIGIPLNVYGKRTDVPVLSLDETVDAELPPGGARDYPMRFPDGEDKPRGQFELPYPVKPHGSHIYYDFNVPGDRSTAKSVRLGLYLGKHPVTGNPRELLPGSYECGQMDEGVNGITYAPDWQPLPALSIAGRFFRAGGRRFTVKGATAFALYARYLNGENIEPLLAELQALGFNFQRIFMLNISVFWCLPWDYGDRFYTEWPNFLRLLAKYGQYALMVATTQAQTLLNNRDRCQEHVDRLAFEGRGETNWLGAFGNELNNADNRLPSGILKPQFGLWSQGDFAGDPGEVGCPEPYLDFVQVHPYSVSGGRRIIGQQAGETGEALGKPCLASENMRFMDMDSSPTHAHDAAKWAAARAAGSFFHSWRGKLSQPYQETADCARAWCEGVDEVDLAYQDGHYVHRRDLETAATERVYAMQLDGRPDFVCVIRE